MAYQIKQSFKVVVSRFIVMPFKNDIMGIWGGALKLKSLFGY